MSGAARHLRKYQEQLDQHGIMVGVSKQALDEALAQLTELQAKYDALAKDALAVADDHDWIRNGIKKPGKGDSYGITATKLWALRHRLEEQGE